jgi:hypothetical protein
MKMAGGEKRRAVAKGMPRNAININKAVSEKAMAVEKRRRNKPENNGISAENCRRCG